MSIRREHWGDAWGQPVYLYTLADHGMEMAVSTYGGAMVRLLVPDAAGHTANITLGYDTLGEYQNDTCYFGSLVGRVANRIGQARFRLDGTEYALDRNFGDHHLHGGAGGFNSQLWESEAAETPDGPCLRLSRVSPDGEQGYPGTVDVSVAFTLGADGVRLDFAASTDRPTPVNLTNHSYFNLTGQLGTSCLGHRLSVPAGRMVDTDTTLIPTGALLDVTGTPFDFRSPRSLGSRIAEADSLLSAAQGYDQYFVLDVKGPQLKKAAVAEDPVSGRCLEVWTTHPGVHVYTGNHIPKGLSGAAGVEYGPQCGFCLEAHGFPDAPNRPQFPSVAAMPGEVMRHTIMYNFSAK